MELNSELRFKIISFLRDAFFIDAGNIFTIRPDPSRLGSTFSSQFFNQLAVGTGTGLRFDLNFIVLRMDVAFPIRKPYLKDGPNWVFDEIDFSSATWRKENLIFNLAIGYPF